METAFLIQQLNQFLNIAKVQDYCPQGLQVAGKDQTKKIVIAVSASLNAIEFASKQSAEMLLVHHGLFWKNEPAIITGWKQARLKQLLSNEINLVCYHLPLDIHPLVGNNIQLAQLLNWQCETMTGEQGLLCVGRPLENISLSKLANDLTQKLQRKPLIIGNHAKLIKKIAWCTGGGQGFFLDAIESGVDVFVTGEASEAQYHLANESGVAFVSAGHYATEQGGVQALGRWITEHYGLEVIFFREENPI